jgi:hypothetical protein
MSYYNQFGNPFRFRQWEKSLKTLSANSLALSSCEIWCYRAVNRVPQHIQFACFYLSIVDDIMTDWDKQTPHHQGKPFGKKVLGDSLLVGQGAFKNFTYTFAKGQEVWK